MLLRNPPALPFEPTLLPQLFAVTKDDSSASMTDLVAIIERSQKLATRVLAMANSAAYGLAFKVSTLSRAVSILGTNEIRVLAVLVTLASVIKETRLPGNFNIMAQWKHQLKTAFAAKALASELGSATGICGPSAPAEDRLTMLPDEAYLAGLLHDVGKFIFAARRPDLWQALNEAWKEKGGEYFEAEFEFWGIDHALIGAEILHHWKLPMLLTEPINWHHAPDLAPTCVMDARILAAADYIAHDKSGGICANAAALLPKGYKAAALAAAVGKGLAAADAEAMVTLVQ